MNKTLARCIICAIWLITPQILLVALGYIAINIGFDHRDCVENLPVALAVVACSLISQIVIWIVILVGRGCAEDHATLLLWISTMINTASSFYVAFTTHFTDSAETITICGNTSGIAWSYVVFYGLIALAFCCGGSRVITVKATYSSI